MPDKKDVLVIVAHPDDEVLGCGGAIVKHVKEKTNVHILILGEGVTSRYNKRSQGLKSTPLRKMKAYIAGAAKILGVKKLRFFSFPDNRFDSVPMLDIVKVIEKVKDEIKPDTIYTHNRNDLNIDHRITFDAVLTACRPVKGSTVNRIYSFEVLSSTEWNYPNSFSPNVYVDISKAIDAKVQAMRAYKSEVKAWPHPRSIEAIRILARKRGCEVGFEFAEAFELIREVSL